MIHFGRWQLDSLAGWFSSVHIDLCTNFLSFKRMKLNAEQKAFLYAGYMQYIIHAIGSAILSASAGMIGAIALASVMTPTNECDTIQKNV